MNLRLALCDALRLCLDNRRLTPHQLSMRSQIDKRTLRRALTTGKNLSIDTLIRGLESIGYTVEIRLVERELTSEEHAYFAAVAQCAGPKPKLDQSFFSSLQVRFSANLGTRKGTTAIYRLGKERRTYAKRRDHHALENAAD